MCEHGNSHLHTYHTLEPRDRWHTCHTLEPRNHVLLGTAAHRSIIHSRVLAHNQHPSDTCQARLARIGAATVALVLFGGLLIVKAVPRDTRHFVVAQIIAVGLVLMAANRQTRADVALPSLMIDERGGYALISSTMVVYDRPLNIIKVLCECV